MSGPRLLLLFIVLVTQIFSSVWFVPGGEALGASVYRVVLIAVALTMILTSGFRSITGTIMSALVAGVALIAWMTLSIGWAGDVAPAIRQISFVAATILLIYVLNTLVRDRRDFRAFGFLVFGLGSTVMLLSLYELQTGIHWFPSSLQDMADANVSLRYIIEDLAWFTFGNPNDLAVHLVLCSTACALFSMRNAFTLSLSAIVVVLTIYLAERLHARIALVSLLLFFSIFLASRVQGRSAFAYSLAAGASLMGALVTSLAIVFSDSAEFLDVSTFIRLKLLASAIAMSADTLFLGKGTGEFESAMWYMGFVGDTYGYVDPHNAFARIIAENGVFGIMLFAFLIFGPLGGLKSSRAISRETAVTCGLVATMPLFLTAGSDPISSSTIQFAIAYLWLARRFAIPEKDHELQKSVWRSAPSQSFV